MSATPVYKTIYGSDSDRKYSALSFDSIYSNILLVGLSSLPFRNQKSIRQDEDLSTRSEWMLNAGRCSRFPTSHPTPKVVTKRGCILFSDTEVTGHSSSFSHLQIPCPVSRVRNDIHVNVSLDFVVNFGDSFLTWFLRDIAFRLICFLLFHNIHIFQKYNFLCFSVYLISNFINIGVYSLKINPINNWEYQKLINNT